jgi:hypothetical protein
MDSERLLSRRKKWPKDMKLVPSEFFKYYHYWEVYDPHIDYDNCLFYKDFRWGHGLHRYRWVIYEIYHDDNIMPIKYAVAEEVLDSEEWRALAMICQCDYCKQPWWNLIKYFTEPDVNCLHVNRWDATTIHKTRKYVYEYPYQQQTNFEGKRGLFSMIHENCIIKYCGKFD